MEDYYRISFKYAKILKGLQEILQTLESGEEQQEEKQEEQIEPTDSQPDSHCEEEDLHEMEEEETLPARCGHHSVWVPSRGPSRCRLFTKTDNESQSIKEPSLRPHLREEEQKSVTEASSSEIVIRELDYHADSASETDGTTRNDAASNEEHEYAKLSQAMVKIPPDCS
ncbi:hypothetical protein JMJ35_006828 [Cladonia borealis]|uniref:Uncharacterized protein n=1 Tax=Cladonia borealis TaxID=184061 RepID=A0AA39QYZ6_9LECA|nr:hypothetical protein JMJ35_006828 [Cladonia borealis]